MKSLEEVAERGELIFKKLVKNAQKSDIEALRRIIPGAMDRLGSTMMDVVAPVKGLEGNISFRRSYEAMRKQKEVLGALLGPEETAELVSLFQLGGSAGEAVGALRQTGASILATKDAVKGTAEGMLSRAVLKKMIKGAEEGAIPKVAEPFGRPPAFGGPAGPIRRGTKAAQATAVQGEDPESAVARQIRLRQLNKR
jgi:hypothetical protein